MSSKGPVSSICCCTRFFGRSPPQSSLALNERESIEIKVNGKPHLMVPHVAIKQNSSVSTIPVSLAIPADLFSESQVDIFETARTSRNSVGSKIIPMAELIRLTRIEEGLEITARSLQETSKSEN
ncbi:unnamed protein product [Caenorhabditis sp. 36 PRJEB53466]|nr:unnamed protein product [Caenorhabditis sp. 36 PRJEB53466]